MTDTPSTTDECLEELYDRFDAAWANGSVPRIEDFVPAAVDQDQRRSVLLELVLMDLEHR